MTPTELYNFDRMGFIHIPGLLSSAQAAALLAATRALEADAMASWNSAKKFRAVWNMDVMQSTKHGYFFHGEQAEGKTMLVEDFWLFPSAFDFLIGHEPTLAYIRAIVQGAFSINNSELRIRYKGNATGMHMGFPHGHGSKYSYQVLDGKVHCNMVRMVYFPHDVDLSQGPICFVPGSHRSQLPVPVQTAVEDEPGVVAIAVKAGDAVLFTEACRHGGFVNRSSQTRYTLHVGYGPAHLRSQNIATMDEDVNVTPALLSRITAAQAGLLVAKRRAAIV